MGILIVLWGAALALALFCGAYNLHAPEPETEIQKVVEQYQSVIRVVLEERLATLRTVLKLAAGDAGLVQAVANRNPAQAHRELGRLFTVLDKNTADILSINLPEKKDWAVNGMVQDMKDKKYLNTASEKSPPFSVNLVRFLSKNTENTALSTDIPIIAPNGQKLGTLCGSLLIGGLDFIKNIRNTMPSRITAIYDRRQLVASSPADESTAAILESISGKGDFIRKDDLVFCTATFRINNLAWPLRIVTGVEADRFSGIYNYHRMRSIIFIFLILPGLAAFFQYRNMVTSQRVKTGKQAGEAGFQAIFEHAAMGIVIISPEGTLLALNPKFCEIINYSCSELTRRHLREITEPEDFQKEEIYISQLLAGERKRYVMEKRYLCRNGEPVWTAMTVSLVRDDTAGIRYLVALVEEITHRRKIENQLQLAERVFENLQEGVFITDIDGNIIRMNKAFCEITGYGPEEVTGRDVRLLDSEQHSPAFYREIWQRLRCDGQWIGEIWGRRKNGEVYPEWMSASAVRSKNGKLSHFIGIFSDLSAAKAAEEALYRMANYDRLTGLANRTLFMDRLNRALLSANENRRVVGVVHIDLDNFKLINETLGYTQGDRILKSAAGRLKKVVKERDTVARLGSDEFGIVLSDMRDSANAVNVALRLQNTFAKPFELDGQEIFIGFSMGISIYPLDSLNSDVLVKNANMALSHAKQIPGKGNYRYFSKEMNDRLSERLHLELAMYGALERKEFRLHYQPKVDMPDGHMTSMEALIRWEHPELGLVSPARFIPLAEENGLIIPIGQWVLETACRQNKAWQAAGFPPLRVSVNLSARQFMQPDLVDRIMAVLTDTGLDPRYLELEITESLLMDDVAKTIEILYSLKSLGVFLSIDDFGTGYSSLSYLKRFPVDAIKIDRSFVSEVLSNPDDAAITSAIIDMAKTLKLRVTAEGAETFGHVRFLREKKCEEIQGYYFSRPLCEGDFSRLLAEGRDFCDMLVL